MVNWKEIHPDFTEELQKEWEEKFSYRISVKEVKKWIEMGLQSTDADYVWWLKIIKEISPRQLLNDVDEKTLRKEYLEWEKTSKLFSEYLNIIYPQSVREQIKKLYVNCKSLQGELDLSCFPNLEILNCSQNKLTSLNLSNCFNLTELDCCSNCLTNCDFLNSLISPEKLIWLNLNNNLISGSLVQLDKLKKLEGLCIDNTNLNSGVEYLPESLSGVNEYGKKRISYFTDQRPNSKVREIKEQLNVFTGENWKRWKELDFTNKQIFKWIKAGAKPDGYEFISWLRDTKKEKPEWITNYREDYQVLSDRFKKYGLCSECKQPNTGEKWCRSCNSKHLEQEFNKWTSGNPEIDQFIQKHQLGATETGKLLEWISYEKFTDVEFLAEGGFGKVYKAKWINGSIRKWNIKNSKWERWSDRKTKIIVLKSLTNTQNITTEFLQEVANHKIIDDWFQSIVPCYGISQDPLTKNYLMIMKYVERGNLRKYLQKDYRKLDFEGKLFRLINIAQGLKDIHQKELIHRDFHSGNILSDNEKCFITDLGLSRTVNSQLKEGEIYGVIPYVAPEVLSKSEYSQKSDIYSFGIIAWEILSGKPPYHDTLHDIDLILTIHDGKRPKFEIKVPKLLEDLIIKCWDTEPEKRPTASEIVKISREWQIEVGNRRGEFYQQIQETEGYNQTLSDEIRFPKYEIHPRVSYISKSINTKLIRERLSSRILNVNSLEYSPVGNNSYLSKDLKFDIGTEIKQVKTESNYQTKELGFDIDTETTKRFRSLSMEETNQKETKSIKLDKVIKEQELQSEPMEIEYQTYQQQTEEIAVQQQPPK